MTRAQLGSIERLGKDRYRISIEGERTDEGKRTRKTKVVRGTRNEAEIELAKMKLDLGKPSGIDLTVRAYWETTYLPAASRVSANSLNTYTHTYKKHVEPIFGDDLMSEMSARYIERKLLTIAAPSAREHAYKLLRQMFNEAWNWDMIESNPFLKKLRIDPPRRKEPDTLDIDGLIRWTQEMRGFRYEAAVLLCAYAGLRREEAVPLDWDKDIEFASNEGKLYAFVSIDKAYPVTGITETKTERSTRTVIIAPPTSMRLMELAGNGPVCPREDGGIASPQSVHMCYKRWSAKRDVYIPLRNLRTTYATLQQTIGTDATITSRALGHTKLSIDYAHYFATNRVAYMVAADALGDAVAKRCYTM